MSDAAPRATILRRLRPSRATVRYVLYLLLCALVGGYGLSLFYRSLEIYRFLKSDHRGIRGRIYRADPELGYSAIPGSVGVHLYSSGVSVPTRFDKAGFRYALGDDLDPLSRRPLVLALGCSYTYGDGVPAEATFAHGVAQELGGTALNAGQCGYGLAQMMVLARRLIPRYKPDFVLAQSSPWLVTRGLAGFARSTFGRVPAPFLTLAPQGTVEVQPPAFRPRVFDLNFDRFDNQRRGAGEFLALFLRAGAPLALHDDWQLAAASLRGVRETPPTPARDTKAVNAACYEELSTLCRENGAVLVIVRVRHFKEVDWAAPPNLRRLGVLVNAQAVLDAQVPDGNREAYDRRFALWGGAPRRLLDTHPNAEAHRIIAQEIVNALRARRP
jgi:hypothetical protein